MITKTALVNTFSFSTDPANAIALSVDDDIPLATFVNPLSTLAPASLVDKLCLAVSIAFVTLPAASVLGTPPAAVIPKATANSVVISVMIPFIASLAFLATAPPISTPPPSEKDLHRFSFQAICQSHQLSFL